MQAKVPRRDWTSDKKWADRFIPQIKPILGTYLIDAAPIEDDAERNTDLIVLKLDSVRIGCRIRSYEYLANYRDEFTIRTSRPNGTRTELAKIIMGWGDYFFYGFCDENEEKLIAWVLMDLQVFRLWFNAYMAKHQGQRPGHERCNRDGSSKFRAFTITDLPKGFVVARVTTNRGQHPRLVR